MNKLNDVSLKLSSKIILKKGKSPTNVGAVISLQAELSHLGYKLSSEALEVVKTLSSKELASTHKFLIKTLAEATGYSHISYQPLFKNFPEDVPVNYLNDDRLRSFFFNQFFIEPKDTQEELSTGLKRLDCGCVVEEAIFDPALYGACPLCQRQNEATATKKGRGNNRRIRLADTPKLKTISLTTEEAVIETLKNLLSAKSSLNGSQKEALEYFFLNFKDQIDEILPEEFFFKENLAVCSALLMKTKNLAEDRIENWVKTATDILRIAVAISGGDISLATNTKFKLGNRERRLVLSLLNETKSPAEDMLRHRQKWLRLGEYLHVGAYKKTYPKAFEVFQELRERSRAIPTFSKKMEAGIKTMKETGEADGLLTLLKTRPGEMARKLDLLLRSTDGEKTLETLSTVITNLSSPMLLKLSKYLGTRTVESSKRFFFLKGPDGKLHVEDKDTRAVLDQELVDKAQNLLTFEVRRRYSEEKTPWKKVYIDPALKNLLVPFALRSASKSLSTLERGSRVKFNENASTLRAFLYWKQPTDSNIDVDLSAIAFDKDWKLKTHISWTQLGDLGAVHSGDVRSAPNGASEFIDIPVDTFLKHGVRYVALTINSFTGQTFKTYECFAGVMQRENPGSGEIFEPKTVEQKFDLASDSTACLTMILDLKEREIIWCDMNMGKGFARGVFTDQKSVKLMADVFLNLQGTRPTIYELFETHAVARGAKVHTTKKEGVDYDMVFDMEKAKDVADIISNWI